MGIASNWRDAKTRLTHRAKRITSYLRDTTPGGYGTTLNHLSDSLDVAGGYVARAYGQARKYANKAYAAGRGFVIAVDIAAEAQRVNDAIRKRPLIAVGAAFGIGSIAALLRRSD
jgi:hypothetical protein